MSLLEPSPVDNPVISRYCEIELSSVEELMTVTLKFKPEIEAGLLAQAQARGMTVEEYVLSVVEGAVLPAVQSALSPDERAAAFEAWSAHHRPTPPLSDDAVSREATYEGRGH